jgi:O-antigen/teichoic acid export membrane protein
VGDINLAIVFALSSLPAFAIAAMLRRESGSAARSPGKRLLDRRLARLMDMVGMVGLAAAAGLWWAGDDRGRATLVVVAMVVLVNALIVAVLLSIFAARRKARGRP